MNLNILWTLNSSSSHSLVKAAAPVSLIVRRSWKPLVIHRLPLPAAVYIVKAVVPLVVNRLCPLWGHAVPDSPAGAPAPPPSSLLRFWHCDFERIERHDQPR